MPSSVLPSRRFILLAGLALPFLLNEVADAATELAAGQFLKAISALEKGSGGRIGIAVCDASRTRLIDYRADDRFPLCSTFKLMAAGAILARSASDPAFLQKRIAYKKKDLVTYSPVTEKNVETGMTVSELCAAALQYSDNSAGNLLLREIGGPNGLTAFARAIGDGVFRLDRWETELNEALPGDPRDSSTPAAMAESVAKLALGNVLRSNEREQLALWLKGNTTGATRIRAGLPTEWAVGDKTGAGGYGTTNDVAILWPPGKKPLVLAIYFTQSAKDAPMRNDIIAEATRLVVTEMARIGV